MRNASFPDAIIPTREGDVVRTSRKAHSEVATISRDHSSSNNSDQSHCHKKCWRRDEERCSFDGLLKITANNIILIIIMLLPLITMFKFNYNSDISAVKDETFE